MSSGQSRAKKPSRKRDLIQAMLEGYGEDHLETVKDLDDAEEAFKRLSAPDAAPESGTPPGSKYKYICATQASLPEFAKVKNPRAIILGIEGRIPRWNKGSEINFAAISRGFPSTNHAVVAAAKLKEAAEEWNSKKVGVTFKRVTNLRDAAFALRYGGDLGDVLAEAFFPNNDDLNLLFVYQRAFALDSIDFMKNVFLHELGHVLGLRHEFALQPFRGEPPEGDAVEFGVANPDSVMSYEFPPKIQQSDVDGAKDFYNFTKPEIGTYKIVDVEPDN